MKATVFKAKTTQIWALSESELISWVIWSLNIKIYHSFWGFTGSRDYNIDFFSAQNSVTPSVGTWGTQDDFRNPCVCKQGLGLRVGQVYPSRDWNLHLSQRKCCQCVAPAQVTYTALPVCLIQGERSCPCTLGFLVKKCLSCSKERVKALLLFLVHCAQWER